MANFETFACTECKAKFAVDSAAIDHDPEELFCPLCQTSIELEYEEDDESDSDWAAD